MMHIAPKQEPRAQLSQRIRPGLVTKRVTLYSPPSIYLLDPEIEGH